MKVTPIGAKSPTATVVGVAANADGNLIAEKKWENKMTTIYNARPESTERVVTERISVDTSAAISLRFANTTEKSFTIGFYTDQYPNNDYVLYDYMGNSIKYKIVEATSRAQILTPEDAPVLQWLRSIKLYIDFAETPTKGSLKIDVITKR